MSTTEQRARAQHDDGSASDSALKNQRASAVESAVDESASETERTVEGTWRTANPGASLADNGEPVPETPGDVEDAMKGAQAHEDREKAATDSAGMTSAAGESSGSDSR